MSRRPGGTFGAESSKVKGAASAVQDKQKAGGEKVKCKEHIEEALRKYWDHGKAPLVRLDRARPLPHYVMHDSGSDYYYTHQRVTQERKSAVPSNPANSFSLPSSFRFIDRSNSQKRVSTSRKRYPGGKWAAMKMTAMPVQTMRSKLR